VNAIGIVDAGGGDPDDDELLDDNEDELLDEAVGFLHRSHPGTR